HREEYDGVKEQIQGKKETFIFLSILWMKFFGNLFMPLDLGLKFLGNLFMPPDSGLWADIFLYRQSLCRRAIDLLYRMDYMDLEVAVGHNIENDNMCTIFL
ncbi:hypothetical protein ACJX0J_031100, partial [Zea mays]